LHRFGPTGKRGDDAGWYVLHLSGIPAGCFGDWRTGASETWCARRDEEMSDAERLALRDRMKAAQRARDAETTRRHGESASAALVQWEAAEPAASHAYLEAKGVRAYGLRIAGRRLLVPMRDAAGKLHSLQFIDADGGKRFLSGGRVKGCYHAIGRPSGAVIVCEGYATGATIHEATGAAVAIAFNAGNLEAAAKSLRAKFPCLSLILAADDDWRTPGNPGLAAAKQAALAVGGLVAVPRFPAARPDRATDFNDLHAAAGIEAVRECFAEIEEAAC
jgi:putative DNA primase/helicase